MAIQSILRNGLVSPTRAVLQRTASTRSILKRPDSLLLSPSFPFAGFSLQHSPVRSPHVNFRPSPNMVSTYAAHSARSYDRAPISLSPMERAYVTSLENFKLSAPPKKPFRSIPAAPRHSQTLANSLASYPRSPYPSAPLVPAEELNNEVTEEKITQRVRASSLNLPKRNKKRLTLGSTSVNPVAPTPSSLGRSIFSPSVNEGKLPASNDLESRLSEAFWKALSLEESDEEVMYTALEYPSSGAVPEIMYGSADGAVWSPALPKPGVAVNRIRESLMSSKRSSFGSGFVRKDFTAPSPNDPFAAFPSFTAAMEYDSGITYPSRVVLE